MQQLEVRPTPGRLRRILASGIACAVLTASAASATLDEQRAAFIDVYPAAERGDWSPAAARQSLLESYVLWPDLRAAWLRAHIDDDAGVRQFLSAYGDLRPAREIRYRFALHLADAGRNDEFLEIHDAHFAAAGDPALDCRAAEARRRLGATAAALQEGRRLWLVGHSQNEACDPLFAWMRSTGGLDAALQRQRYELAIGNRDFLLARYVARSLPDESLRDANRWLRARGNPESFLKSADVSISDRLYREQLAYAAGRLAISDPESAYGHWVRLRKDLSFEADLDVEVARAVALWSARRNQPGNDALIARLPPDAIDNEVLRWRVRSALRDGDWQVVLGGIEAFDGDEADEEEWRFWKGVALEATGNEADAMLIFSSLARERSYHGFLAADRLGVDYVLESDRLAADDDIIAALERDPLLVRARELFFTGQDGRARSEWNAAMRAMDGTAKAQAALLADRWGWHSRAIAMAASAGRYDSLDLRYPLAHRDAFRSASEAAGIPESWAYGVARSESIFMRDIRSSAGAIGLMQLMPATGRSTAQDIRLPYRGIDTLIDPASNVRLGTWYLGQMKDRFDGHPAVATAAYNAGPHRVEQWLPNTRPLDARIWVETIPYNETRAYVRRVLTASVIFEWRLSGKAPRLSDQLPEIRPPAVARSAARQ